VAIRDHQGRDDQGRTDDGDGKPKPAAEPRQPHRKAATPVSDVPRGGASCGEL
jgi:hypothetical protein